MLTRRACLQAMSENEEIADLLEENKAEVDQLTATYNRFKELLDQHKLTEDLDQLLACVHSCHSKGEHHLIVSRKLNKLQTFLVESKDERPDRKRPSLKAVWKAGDLRPKL